MLDKKQSELEKVNGRLSEKLDKLSAIKAQFTDLDAKINAVNESMAGKTNYVFVPHYTYDDGSYSTKASYYLSVESIENEYNLPGISSPEDGDKLVLTDLAHLAHNLAWWNDEIFFVKVPAYTAGDEVYNIDNSEELKDKSGVLSGGKIYLVNPQALLDEDYNSLDEFLAQAEKVIDCPINLGVYHGGEFGQRKRRDDIYAKYRREPDKKPTITLHVYGGLYRLQIADIEFSPAWKHLVEDDLVTLANFNTAQEIINNLDRVDSLSRYNLEDQEILSELKAIVGKKPAKAKKVLK